MGADDQHLRAAGQAGLDARAGVLQHDRVACVDAEARGRSEVSLGIRLAFANVVGADDLKWHDQPRRAHPALGERPTRGRDERPSACRDLGQQLRRARHGDDPLGREHLVSLDPPGLRRNVDARGGMRGDGLGGAAAVGGGDDRVAV